MHSIQNRNVGVTISMLGHTWILLTSMPPPRIAIFGKCYPMLVHNLLLAVVNHDDTDIITLAACVSRTVDDIKD